MTDGDCYQESQLGLAGGFTYHGVHPPVLSCEVGNGILSISQRRMLKLQAV